MSGEKLAEGILATTRTLRDPEELNKIAEEKRINTIAARKRGAIKQVEIDEQVEKGIELGKQRREDEEEERRKIHERVQAQNLQQSEDKPESPQKVTVENRVKEVAKSRQD